MIENDTKETESCGITEMNEMNKRAQELVKARTEQYKKFAELTKENTDGQTNTD